MCSWHFIGGSVWPTSAAALLTEVCGAWFATSIYIQSALCSAVFPWPQILSWLLHRVQFVYKSHSGTKCLDILHGTQGVPCIGTFTPQHRETVGSPQEAEKLTERWQSKPFNSFSLLRERIQYNTTAIITEPAPVNQICFWKQPDPEISAWR